MRHASHNYPLHARKCLSADAHPRAHVVPLRCICSRPEELVATCVHQHRSDLGGWHEALTRKAIVKQVFAATLDTAVIAVAGFRILELSMPSCCDTASLKLPTTRMIRVYDSGRGTRQGRKAVFGAVSQEPHGSEFSDVKTSQNSPVRNLMAHENFISRMRRCRMLLKSCNTSVRIVGQGCDHVSTNRG
jgi:hypothetical protein